MTIKVKLYDYWPYLLFTFVVVFCQIICRHQNQGRRKCRGPRRQYYPPFSESFHDVFALLVESGDVQLPPPQPNGPSTDMTKYCPYHQKNGHTLEECYVVKDKIYDLHDQGKNLSISKSYSLLY